MKNETKIQFENAFRDSYKSDDAPFRVVKDEEVSGIRFYFENVDDEDDKVIDIELLYGKKFEIIDEASFSLTASELEILNGAISSFLKTIKNKKL